jgi:hypothetical protein
VSVVQLDFYDREDLNGTPLLSIDDEDAFLEGFEMRVSLRDLGSGLITLSRQGVSADDNPSFLFDVARAESFVRVLVPSISTDYLFGFFLDNRKTQVLSTEESAGMDIIIGGSGPLYYLSRAILWNEKFSGTAATVDEETGLWTFPDNSNWNAGKVFETLLAEDSNNTLATFLPDLTLGFDETNDSDGNAWTDLFDGGLELEIGTHYLQALRIMQEQADDLDAVMHLGAPGSPLMRLDMYNRLGRDLTGSTMGAGVVLFKAGINSDPLSGNILTGLEASGQSTLKPSHVLVRGADGVYSQVDRSLWSAGDFTKAVAVDYQETSGETSLFRYGRRIMADWDLREDAQQLEIHPGFDPTNGLYMPGPDGSSGHFWIGDDITLKTGGEVVHSVLDYHYTTERVTGIRMVLDEAVDGSTDAKAALSWHIVPELNEVYGLTGGDLNRGVASRHNHPPNPALCRPGTPATVPTISDTADGQDDDGNQDIAVTVGSGLDRALYVLVQVDALPTVTWYPGYINAGTPGAGTALSLVDSQIITGSVTLYVFRLTDPATSTAGTSAVRIAKGAGVRAIAGVWSLAGVDQTTPETAIGKNTGTGSTSSVTVTPGDGDLIIDVAGWSETNATVTVPTEAGDQTYRFAHSIDRTFGLPDYAMGGSDGSDPTPAWDFANSHPWGAVAVAVKTANPGTPGDTPQDIAATASVGTSIRASRCDHVHAHGNITTGGPYHMAEDVTAADAGGYFTGTTVEAQLQELGAASGGAVSTVVAHGAMGATETFDFTDGTDHEGTQDANLTVTLSGATTGEAAWMTLKLTQDGTGGRTLTLPASVVTKSDVESGWDTTASAVNILSLFSYDGGTSWYGFLAGGTSATALDDLTDVTITSPATAQRLRYNGSAWVNSSLVWRPVTTYDGTNWLPAVDGDGNAIISEA